MLNLLEGMHSILLTGLVTRVSKSGYAPNQRLVHIDTGYIDIPEINLKTHNNTVIVNLDCYVKNNLITREELKNKNISLSNPKFNIAWISSPEGGDFAKYLHKNLLKTSMSHVALSDKKLLLVNFCQTIVQVDHQIFTSVLENSRFYSCTLKGSSIYDVAYECKNLIVLFKDSKIKPEIGKTYIVMGQVVNFPMRFSQPTGKHGIYGQITKEIVNEQNGHKTQ